MDEQEYLKCCLHEIEKKLSWRDSRMWKESDFKKLSEIITDSTKISISPHTLKRLYGKIKYNKYYNPQQATKDALAKFLEYPQWDDFILYCDENKKKQKSSSHKSIFKNKKRHNILFVAVAVVSVLVIFFAKNFMNNLDHKARSFAFGLVDSVGTVPFTVNVNYDISELESDSVFLDFDFNHPVMGEQIETLEKNRHNHNFTYQIPGYYQLTLLTDKKELASCNVLAMSGGWDSYILYEQNMNKLWLDNKLPLSTQNGHLYISPKVITDQGFGTISVFYILHRLFQQFGIDGDNFQLETRFKNSGETGGITCFDSVFRIFCENNRNHVMLMEDGCSQFSEIKFGETALDGQYDDLSDLKLDTKSWNTLTITVRQKKVTIVVNNGLIYKGGYEQPNGQIIGLECLSKGTGMIDFIRIKDLNTAHTFVDEFE